ncbi:synaptotagmin-2-like [Bidens hawaiensis]|uniref:synaptotagmin-2-like n=1 Tax=Bidens hawaiensis TaxID=980011 RepID=UPI00404A6D8D
MEFIANIYCFLQNPSTNNYFPPKDDNNKLFKHSIRRAIDVASKSEDAGVLVITIHRGVNLEVKHPFVSLLVGTDKKHTTTKKHNQNPVWDESFQFTLEKPAEAILDLEVCSGSVMDRIHHKYNLGGVKIDVMDVVKQKHTNSIFHIGNGSIHAELHFLHSTRPQTLKL